MAEVTTLLINHRPSSIAEFKNDDSSTYTVRMSYMLYTETHLCIFTLHCYYTQCESFLYASDSAIL